jgi:hypothetical protein
MKLRKGVKNVYFKKVILGEKQGKRTRNRSGIPESVTEKYQQTIDQNHAETSLAIIEERSGNRSLSPSVPEHIS